MIALTHLLVAISLAYALDRPIVTAAAFALAPDFDSTFDFLYPFIENGIMHSFLAAATFSFLVFVYSEKRSSAESCLIGYLSALSLDLVSGTALPLFFPSHKVFSLGFATPQSLKINSAIITLSLALMALKKHQKLVKDVWKSQ